MGSTAPSRAGLRKRTPFHDPSSGPVSASPSPTTQATSEVRVVERGTEGVDQRVPSSPPSWIDPGVGTLTWLGMPPGVENWRTSRVSPIDVRETWG